MVELMVNNELERIWKWSWPNKGTNLEFIWKKLKKINISVRTVGVLDDIRATFCVSQWDSRSFELMTEFGQSDCLSEQPLKKS
jgi:hypothetical protein